MATAALKAAAREAAAKDPLLAAMDAELTREQALLVLPGMQRPFFIEYRLDDFHTWDAVANYGALTREDRNHQRIVRVTVRIGDYARDSSSNRGEGAVELAPGEDDPAALRYALWSATDTAYKAALGAFAAKQAALKRFEKQPTEADFAPAPSTRTVEPVATLRLDEAEWKRRIVDASGAFLSDPKLRKSAADVQFSSASARGVAVNRYLVSSEGTVLRHGFAVYTANVSVGGQAADGMRLSRDNGTTANDPAKLEDAAAFHARAIRDTESFLALRDAPVVDAEDYHGPVLFSGDAATDVMDALFVPNVLAQRPDLGTSARTTGAYQSSLRARVLPEMLSATDDPTETTFAGRDLVGSYRVDDEGVPAEAVHVAENGKLNAYLTSRTPIRDFAISNGHGRAAPGQAARAGQGVMIFTAAHPTHDMHARLVALAKEQGKDVYEADTLAGELAPRTLFRVHPDGTRQLVRGAVFDELDTRSLRSDIVAAGDDPYVQNRLGPLPTTTIAPSLLFGDIVVKRANDEQGKLPYYAPPTP